MRDLAKNRRVRELRAKAVAGSPSGGILKTPKTERERLLLTVRLRKLKADYLRREEARRVGDE